MAGALYGSIDWLNGDVEFHQAIAGATHNTYVVQVVGFVSERVRKSILAVAERRSDDMAQVTEREHRRILAAIAAQDEAAAQQPVLRVGVVGALQILELRSAIVAAHLI
jgi:DNA-binding FadR family transcriptional regulator